MHIEYLFLLRSRVNLGFGDWEPLSFQRNGLQICIPKPISDTNYYIKIRPGNGPVMFDISRLKPGSASALEETMVSIEIKSESEVPEGKVIQTSEPTALEVFHHFKSWIRVLTRQHWIGYQSSAFPKQDFNVNAIMGKFKKSLSTGGSYFGFDYWRVLDQSIWNALGEKLAKGGLPSPGQLFFCESLAAIGQVNLAQAVVELGAACELEVYSTIADILQGGKVTPEKLCKIERLSFGRKVKLLGSLNGRAFKRFDTKAARLVNRLYGMRGAAIHRAHLPFVNTSKSLIWNASQLTPYIHAAEKLFQWLDNQRSALA